MIQSTNINKKGLKIIEVIEKFIEKQNKDFFDVTGLELGYNINDVDFYSKKDWKARGEEYSLDSDVVMTFDGGFMYDIVNNYGQAGIELNEALKEIGLYTEQGYSWNCGFYEI